MAETITPDVCILGAGSAGLSAAAIAGAFQAPAVLVERGRMGGECLHTGCVPSKALLAAAHAAETARRAQSMGIGTGEPQVDFTAVKAHVRDVIASIAPADTAARYRAMGLRVIQGEAAFADRRTLVVGDLRIRARRFVLATGSRPALPDLPGLAEIPFLTNDTIFDVAELPGHLVVLGTGPVGAELAQAFRRLGSRVTMVGSGPLLGRLDPEIAGHVDAALRAEGVAIHTHTRALSAAKAGAGIALTVRMQDGAETTLEGTHLLVATGRSAVTEGLGLEQAGIRHDPSGILVDAGMRTSNRRVFAVGDCVGGPQGATRFTHAAGEQAGIAMRRILFRLKASFDPLQVPRTVYTDPEIATTGLSEQEARAAGHPVTILRFPMAENDRARAERLTRGEIKLICTRKGRVLGAAVVGAQAGDLIVPWILALRKELEVSDFRDLVLPYPTRSEVSRRAAVSFYSPQLRRPGLARILRVLRWLG